MVRVSKSYCILLCPLCTFLSLHRSQVARRRPQGHWYLWSRHLNLVAPSYWPRAASWATGNVGGPRSPSWQQLLNVRPRRARVPLTCFMPRLSQQRLLRVRLHRVHKPTSAQLHIWSVITTILLCVRLSFPFLILFFPYRCIQIASKSLLPATS